MLLYKSGILCVKRDGMPLIDRVEKSYNFLFSKNTTYGLGGSVDVCYYPKNIPQAVAVYDYLRLSGIRYVTVGNGSNILASDGHYCGAVVNTRKMKGIARIDENTLCCLAGTTVAELLAYCKRHNLSGLEYLYGIPATMGGIVFMNGGAGGTYINSNVLSVKIFYDKIVNLSNKNCNFCYKQSTMRDINSPILCVFLRVASAIPQIIEEKVNYYKLRRLHLPGGRSCGCVFKNPEGDSAGRLIEAAGLKGIRIGGARVSTEHANFIINSGATAADVARLISLVKKIVREKCGVTLEEEVVYIGEFNDSDS